LYSIIDTVLNNISYMNLSIGTISSTILWNDPLPTNAPENITYSATDDYVIEDTAVFNGIYTWSNATVITRATDYDSVPEVEAGDFVFCTGGTLYDIESYLGLVPGESDSITEPGLPQFGDEQPFPGSIRLVRATDIERMSFMVNLPSSQFTTTQNPTYPSGADKRITEVALLNSNKEVMVIAKTAKPVKRSGTQVFAVRLDF
jgi:hypothetical protein